MGPDVKHDIAPILFRAVLGLYHDLPAVGTPSINAGILHKIGCGEAISWLCQFFAPLSEDGNHVEALFCQFFWFEYQDGWRGTRCHPEALIARECELENYRRLGVDPPPTVSPRPYCPCPLDKTPWHAVVLASRKTCT